MITKQIMLGALLAITGIGFVSAAQFNMELFEKAYVDQADFKNFEKHYNEGMYDVDKIPYKDDAPGFETVGSCIDFHVSNPIIRKNSPVWKKLYTLVRKNRTLTKVRDQFQNVLLNKEDAVDVFCQTVKDNNLDIDTISFGPLAADEKAARQTIGQILDAERASKNIKVAGVYQKLNDNRPLTTLREAIQKTLSDHTAYNEFVQAFDQGSYDIATVLYNPCTIGESKKTIIEVLREAPEVGARWMLAYAHKKGRAPVGESPEALFAQLVTDVCENGADSKGCEVFQGIWNLNVDVIAKDGSSLGEYLNARSDSQDKHIQSVIKLVDQTRTEGALARYLIDAAHKDAAQEAHLAYWYAELKWDLNAVQTGGQTLRQYVDGLQNDRIAQLLAPTQGPKNPQNTSNQESASWSTPTKLVLAGAALGGVVFGYKYWYVPKHDQTKAGAKAA